MVAQFQLVRTKKADILLHITFSGETSYFGHTSEVAYSEYPHWCIDLQPTHTPQNIRFIHTESHANSQPT